MCNQMGSHLANAKPMDGNHWAGSLHSQNRDHTEYSSDEILADGAVYAQIAPYFHCTTSVVIGLTHLFTQ